MVAKSKLHTAAGRHEDDTHWVSYPPHAPGTCWGPNGDDCPPTPDEPCQHKHGTLSAALTCSRNREVHSA
jgi:hypothetical protein